MTITTATVLEHGLPFKEAYYHLLDKKQHDYEWSMNDETRQPFERVLLLWLMLNSQVAIQNEWPETALANLGIMNCILYGCITGMIEGNEYAHSKECMNNALDNEILGIIKKYRMENN